MKGLLLTYIALLVLLALTVMAHGLRLGPLQTPIALGIAGAKAFLVAWVFMALRTSIASTRLAASAGILWILFLFILGGLDIFFRPGP